MKFMENDKEPAFKVVDKRRFTSEGQLRATEDVNETSPVADLREPVKAPEPPKASDAKLKPEIDFSLFVQSMAHQAMLGMGMMPWPDSNLINTDIRVAKEAIDVLRMLKEKTLGNLSLEENRLIDTLLYQLQMAFVEISKSPTGDVGKVL